MNATLRPGTSGSFVPLLHQLLKEVRALPDAASQEVSAGIYGPKTEEAVRAFQQHENLVVDAIVGPRTWAALTNAVKMRPPHGRAEFFAYYGDPRSTTSAGDVSAKWERENCVVITHLVGVPKLYVHQKIVEPLSRAWAKATRNGWRPLLGVGCFNPRNKKRSDEISTHFFAAGLDIDADYNPFIADCPHNDPRREVWRQSPRRIPDEVFDAFLSENWTVGRDFSVRFDPMHFQYGDGY